MSVNKKQGRYDKPFKVCPEHGVCCKCGKQRDIGTYPTQAKRGK